MGQMLSAPLLSFCMPPVHQGSPRCEHNRATSSDSEADIAGGRVQNHSHQVAGAARSWKEERPRMIVDCEQDECFGCSVRFSVIVRRHHCRRCRNIFCQQCSSRTGRVLVFEDVKPVRLCDECADAVPAENRFVERHLPLLFEGATLVKQALLARKPVHLRVTADLSVLEERRAERPGHDGDADARRHRLDDVESVTSVEGGSGRRRGAHAETFESPSAFLIRFKEKGQLRMEACSPAERDAWVQALKEAVRRQQSAPLAARVEAERWARREKVERDAQKRSNEEKRRENEALRLRMAEKYGLDPQKYASRARPSRAPASEPPRHGAGGYAAMDFGFERISDGGGRAFNAPGLHSLAASLTSVQ